jgi:hypothetical protein
MLTNALTAVLALVLALLVLPKNSNHKSQNDGFQTEPIIFFKIFQKFLSSFTICGIIDVCGRFSHTKSENKRK